MSVFLSIVAANIVISLGSLSGVLALVWKRDSLKQFLHVLVALSTGTLMGGAFLHLLPEAIELNQADALQPFILSLVAFVGFFVVEKVLHWRHCHDEDCQVHEFGYLNLLGDAIHNFIDGLAIAASFVTSMELGIATSLAIAMHEIPQEIGDLGVLLHAGFSKQKAIIFNLLISLMALVGGVVGYLVTVSTDSLTPLLLPIAAGGFLYIAASDLMPELRKEENLGRSIASFVFFIAGILLMYVLHLYGHE